MIFTHSGYRVTSLCQFWVISVIWSDVRRARAGESGSRSVSPVRSEPEDDLRSVLADTGTEEDTRAQPGVTVCRAETRNKTQTKSRWELILKIRTTGHWKIRFYLTVFVSIFWSQHKSAPIKLFRSAKCFMFCAGGLELETNLTFLDYISYLSSI